jgi:hypothetical protein
MMLKIKQRQTNKLPLCKILIATHTIAQATNKNLLLGHEEPYLMDKEQQQGEEKQWQQQQWQKQQQHQQQVNIFPQEVIEGTQMGQQDPDMSGGKWQKQQPQQQPGFQNQMQQQNPMQIAVPEQAQEQEQFIVEKTQQQQPAGSQQQSTVSSPWKLPEELPGFQREKQPRVLNQVQECNISAGSPKKAQEEWQGMQGINYSQEHQNQGNLMPQQDQQMIKLRESKQHQLNQQEQKQLNVGSLEQQDSWYSSEKFQEERQNLQQGNTIEHQQQQLQGQTVNQHKLIQQEQGGPSSGCYVFYWSLSGFLSFVSVQH